MNWLQTRNIEGIYRRFVRFKCNQCGTTGEIADIADRSVEVPSGWRSGPHAGMHFCPGCNTSPRKKLLPVIA